MPKMEERAQLDYLKITVIAADSVLYESPYLGQHGISFLLEGTIGEESKSILVDVGQNAEAQEKKMQKMVQRVYDQAYSLFIYSPLTLYAVNNEVDFIPVQFQMMRFMEASVTKDHWSLRGKNN